jgi:hypothetical protein
MDLCNYITISISRSVSLVFSLSVSLFASLCFSLFVSLSLVLSVSLSRCLYVSLSPSFSLSVSLALYIYLSLCLCFSRSLCVSLALFLSLSKSHFRAKISLSSPGVRLQIFNGNGMLITPSHCIFVGSGEKSSSSILSHKGSSYLSAQSFNVDKPRRSSPCTRRNLSPNTIPSIPTFPSVPRDQSPVADTCWGRDAAHPHCVSDNRGPSPFFPHVKGR